MFAHACTDSIKLSSFGMTSLISDANGAEKKSHGSITEFPSSLHVMLTTFCTCTVSAVLPAGHTWLEQLRLTALLIRVGCSKHEAPLLLSVLTESEKWHTEVSEAASMLLT